MTALREKILKKLADSTSQHPVMLDTLRKVASPLVDDMQQLYDLLDQLSADTEVNRMSGYKDGKQYVAYWLIPHAGGILPRYMPYRSTTIPPAALTAPANKQTPATPAATVTPKKETPPMPNKPARKGTGRTALLKYITDNPGQDRATLIAWYVKNVPGADRSKASSTLGNLTTAEEIRHEGTSPHLRYFAADTGSQPAASTRATKKPAKTITADHENAIKAAQGADLLVGDLKALAKAGNPLVGELATEMLITAHQLSDKLNRLAGHIHQLQGA